MARDVVGTSIGPYHIRGLLGAGGMGEVYRAHDPRLRRDVAIKIIRDAVALDPDRLRRFEREAQILAALDHRHIAAIYGLEQLEGTNALVLEFVDGITLADRIATGALALPDALTVARQIADAVETAHEQGIIHRDLKPANIKIRPDGVVKVLDFGLARMDSEPSPAGAAGEGATVTSVATRAGIVMGTAAYMSPEQARGQGVDKRTDIWAFGCILFEMFTGSLAFAGASAPDTVANVLQREPDWTRLPAGTPRAIRELTQRCLQKDVRQRLRDMGDARIVIEDALARPSVETSGSPQMRRRFAPSTSWIAVALVSAAVTLGLTGLARQRAGNDGPPEFDRVIRLIGSDAHEFGPAISPDGKWVAYLSNVRGPTDLWLKFIAGGDAVNLTAKHNVGVQTAGFIGGIDISPDATQIAFSGGAPDAGPAQMSTWLIQGPLGGVPRFLGAGQGMRWSPDGKRIALVAAGGPAGDSVVVADADGQNRREVLVRQGGKHAHWLRWSADNRYLYFNYGFQSFNTEPTEIFRVPVSGGPPEPVVNTARRAAFPLPSPDGRGLFFAANPDSVDAGLWWRDLRTGRDRRITSGIGEYSAPQLSADGRRLVAVVSDVRQALKRIAIRFDSVPALEPLTDGFAGDFDPCWAPDGSRVIFSSSRTGNRNIWSARADLSEPVPLTTGAAIDERPAYSRDARQVAFVSDRGGRRGIWVVSADGGAPRLIVHANVLDSVSWAPDGKRIVYSEPGREVPQLTTVEVATGKTGVILSGKAATGPAWSPLTGVVAYVETEPTGAFLRFVNGDGKPNTARFPDTVTRLATGSLSWSPDGRRLVGVSLPGSRAGHIWIIEPDGPQPFRKLIELPPDVNIRGVTWSPDGSSIVVGHVKSTGDIVLAERLR